MDAKIELIGYKNADRVFSCFFALDRRKRNFIKKLKDENGDLL